MVGTAFVVVLLAATLVAAIPIYERGRAEQPPRAARAAPATESNVQATVGVFGGSDPALDETVEEVARDVFRDTGVAIFASGESEIFTAGERSLVFGFFEELPDHASLVTGRWPKTTDPVAEVVMPEAAARASTSAWAIASMRAAASAPPKRARGSSASIARSASPPRTGGAIRSRPPAPAVHSSRPESFFGLGLQSTELSWRLEPRHDRIAIGEASEVRQNSAAWPAA